MTISPQTERERRSRRFKSLVAGAAGVALLLGGSTFAYWSDSIDKTVGNAKNGVLDVDVFEHDSKTIDALAYDLRHVRFDSTDIQPTYALPIKDQSTDSSTQKRMGALITLASAVAVPGDHLEIDMPFTLTATGNNMKYDLQIKAGANVNLSGSGWTVTAQLYKVGNFGNVGGPQTATPVGSSFPVSSLSKDNYTSVITGVTEQATDAVYFLVFDATLPSTVGNASTQEYQDAKLAFGTLSVKVQQVTI
ncbi:MAG: SipW-dependent-type signal peptide-containing protein [Bifidobacteriaceae bacterium]|jgi:predicted ribosomally synthesized peptide with SipW-like signal peptide|nr:SipW-dependent-type signal peptide-containing protein [Bifidobacteriaceae bacterium]